MELQEWIDGIFEETDIDYTIAGENILYKKETEYLKKGVKLLCDKLHPKSVLEFGFGKGWTATEFQEQGINRHVILEPNKENYQMALEWKDSYDTDIEILNIFSWDYDSDEKFDLVYNDRVPFSNETEELHETNIKKILSTDSYYARNAGVARISSNKSSDDCSILFEHDSIGYKQSLFKGLYGNS